MDLKSIKHPLCCFVVASCLFLEKSGIACTGGEDFEFRLDEEFLDESFPSSLEGYKWNSINEIVRNEIMFFN